MLSKGFFHSVFTELTTKKNTVKDFEFCADHVLQPSRSRFKAAFRFFILTSIKFLIGKPANLKFKVPFLNSMKY